MQHKILFYDKEVEEACFAICKTLNINNMPSYDSKHYFELTGGCFTKKLSMKLIF